MNNQGESGQALFIEWHRAINSSDRFVEYGTKMIDVTEEKHFTDTTDIDFVIVNSAGNPFFHEVKTFNKALRNGNLYIEQIKNSMNTVAYWGLHKEKRPNSGLAAEFMPEELYYQSGTGWIYKNESFHADVFHFYLPMMPDNEGRITANAEELERMQARTAPGAKLITEAPTGIWISMDYAALMNLNIIAKRDANFYNGGTNLLLNFSTSLVMLAETPQQFLKQPITVHLNGRTLGQGYPSSQEYTIQIRPVVKCITPDKPDEVVLEIMEPAVTDYYIPKRLLQICEQPSAYRLYSDRYPSKYDCQGLAENMQAALIKALTQARMF